MPRHATNTCFLVHSQEKILLSLTLVRIGEMIQEMPFRMSFPHVLMAGRPQQILHGGTLKYLFGYFKIRIFYCSNRSKQVTDLLIKIVCRMLEGLFFQNFSFFH